MGFGQKGYIVESGKTRYELSYLTRTSLILTEKLSVTTYNCRGAMNNVTYIQHLLDNTDVLCIQEHLLSEENASFMDTITWLYT